LRLDSRPCLSVQVADIEISFKFPPFFDSRARFPTANPLSPVWHLCILLVCCVSPAAQRIPSRFQSPLSPLDRNVYVPPLAPVGGGFVFFFFFFCFAPTEIPPDRIATRRAVPSIIISICAIFFYLQALSFRDHFT